MCGLRGRGGMFYHHGFFSPMECCSPRWFMTEKEKVTHMEEYKKYLEEEIKAIEEEIKRIKEEKD
jgi:hypothetical protein